jgi:hypothetical protein
MKVKLFIIRQTISNLSNEMKDFKAFVLADIEDSRADRKAMNKKWGELAMKDDNMDLLNPELITGRVWQ